MQNENNLLDTKTTANKLGVSPQTLEGWRVRGGGPPFVKVSHRCVRYRDRDLEQWVDDRVVTSTTEADSRRA